MKDIVFTAEDLIRILQDIPKPSKSNVVCEICGKDRPLFTVNFGKPQIVCDVCMFKVYRNYVK